MARPRKKLPEINASSMADIAFLLLVFFLVTTTIELDKGLLVLLPPPLNDQEQMDVKFNDRDVLEVLINSQDQLLVENEPFDIKKLKRKTKQHISNFGKDPNFSTNPKKAVVSLKNDRGTSYDIYIQVQNELKAAYREVRNEYSNQRYQVDFEYLNKDQKTEVRKQFPLRISEAEPEEVGGA